MAMIQLWKLESKLMELVLTPPLYKFWEFLIRLFILCFSYFFILLNKSIIFTHLGLICKNSHLCFK